MGLPVPMILMLITKEAYGNNNRCYKIPIGLNLSNISNTESGLKKFIALTRRVASLIQESDCLQGRKNITKIIII
jgi:hypothetical protein